MVDLMQFLPQKKRKFPSVDKSKYYKFHRDYGHDTNDCIILKDEIETLIKKGKLAKYKQYKEREGEEEENKERQHSYSPGWRETGGKSSQAEQ